jgi:hypothetical protein
MRGRARGTAVVIVVLAAVALSIGSILLGDPAQVSVAIVVVPALTAPLVGGVIAVRQPGNRIAWLFCLMGLGLGAAMFVEGYVFTASIHGLPGIGLAAWLGTWLYLVFITGGVALFAVFPSGRVPSGWLRAAFFVAVGSGISAALGFAFGIETIDYPGIDIPNPLGAPRAVATLLLTAAEVSSAVLIGSAGLFALALLIRLRRAEGIERQQLKWFVSAAAVIAAAIPISLFLPDPWNDVAWAVTIFGFGAGLPIAAGIAVLRYRLYDIDVVIRRTLVYGALVAILAAVYVALVLGLQSVLSGVTGNQTLPVALSTLAIAALFGPVRARVREVVDRRFYRSRYDAQRTLESFAVRLRDQVELDSVGRTLVSVAGDAVQPASASVWVRGHRT